jgi:heme-degrading monooxygenase HmoA
MVTFVNMFTVKTGQQNAAFEGIQHIYTEVVKFQEGFISAVLLKSDDGNTVTAIAQWEKAENLASLSQHSRFRELHNESFYESIVKVEPRTYSAEGTIVTPK